MIKLIINDISNENSHTLKALADFFIELSKLPEVNKKIAVGTSESTNEDIPLINKSLKKSQDKTEDANFTENELKWPTLSDRPHLPCDVVYNNATSIPDEKSPAQIFGKNTQVSINPKASFEVNRDNLSTAPTIDYDSRGILWDARIHSRTKSKLADGSWKSARGIDKNLVQKLEQQQLGTAEGVNIPPSPAIIPVSPLNKSETVSFDITYAALANLILKESSTGKLSKSRVIELLKSVGVSNLPELAARLDLVPAVYELIQEELSND